MLLTHWRDLAEGLLERSGHTEFVAAAALLV
jgi:hypothetical protein